MAKVNAVEFAKMWGSIASVDTKILLRLADMMHEEILKRQQANGKATRIDDQAKPHTEVPTL